VLFSTFSVRNEAAQLTDVTEMFNNIPLCDNLRTDLNTNVRFMAARILKVASLFLPKYLYTIKQQMNNNHKGRLPERPQAHQAAT